MLLRASTPAFLLALVAMASLAQAQAEPPSSGGVVVRSAPIPGFSLTPLQNDTLEVAQGASMNVSYLLRNNGSEALHLHVSVLEHAAPNATRYLDLAANLTNLTLAPGGEAVLGVEISVRAQTPNGTERRANLAVVREGTPARYEHRVTVRAPGECDGCPPPEPDTVFTTSGQLPPGMFVSDGSGSFRVEPPQEDDDTPRSASDFLEDPYAETPGFAPALVFAAVGAALLAAGARRR